MKRLNPGHVLVAGCCLALMLGVGFGIGITLKATQASRNSAGTYSLATAPVTAGQVITPALWNNTFADLAADMTLSLDRNGRGGMLAAWRGIDGTLAAPAYSWTSETGSGLWRNGAGDVRMSVLGALRENWTTTGVAVTGTFSATGASTLTGDVTASGKLGIGGAPTHPLDVTVSGSAATAIVNLLEPSAANGNGLTLNIGQALAANQAGGLTYTQQATAANSTICLGVAGNASAFCADGNNTTALTKPTVATGVGADGSGFKHKRVASCTTPASASSTCDTTVTWGTAFADANYTVTCSGEGSPSGTPLAVGVASKTASAVTYRISCQTALASSFTNIDCVAVHD